LPTRAIKPPAGSDWLHEIKHDGYRLTASDPQTATTLEVQMRFSGTMTIHNAKTGLDQIAKIRQGIVTTDRLAVDSFLFPDWTKPYTFEAKMVSPGSYKGAWKCQDGRNGSVSCKFDAEALTITGAMVEDYY
jgi:hypothetical protein